MRNREADAIALGRRPHQGHRGRAGRAGRRCRGRPGGLEMPTRAVAIVLGYHPEHVRRLDPHRAAPRAPSRRRLPRAASTTCGRSSRRATALPAGAEPRLGEGLEPHHRVPARRMHSARADEHRGPPLRRGRDRPRGRPRRPSWSIGSHDDELLWVDVSGDEADDPWHPARRAGPRRRSADEALAAELQSAAMHAVLDGARRADAPVADDDADHEPAPIQVARRRRLGDHPPCRVAGAPRRQREKITDQREIGRLRPVEFVVAILGWHLDGFFEAAEHLEREVDQLDEQALRTERDLLGRLVAMRRRDRARAQASHRPHIEVYAEIARPDFLPELEDAEQRAAAFGPSRAPRARRSRRSATCARCSSAHSTST